ncbi:porin [Riemerella anatipestifer]|nr:porin [Riemerella anatipestifer]
MKYFLITIFIFQTAILYAQNDTLKKLAFSGYGELYYSYDFSNPYNHEKPNYLYNHKRHNEINTNLVLVKTNYTDKKIRGNLGLMAGNYAQYNLSTEPTWAQFVYEANIGVKLSKKQNIWLDVGILPSHIGFENAISADCWTLTRSILAENSPYYETGLKVGYTNRKENLNISFLVLNGWQRIQKPDFIQKPSFGIQANYKPNENLTLNYSNFIGSDKPDSLKSFRKFHNFYLQYELTKKFGIIAGFDIGSDKNNLGKYGTWYAPVLILRQNISSKIRIALRGEYYYDKEQVIISTGTANGFQIFGLSSNFDYEITEKLRLRFEGKMYQSKDNIFQNNNTNYSLTTNMTIRL